MRRASNGLTTVLRRLSVSNFQSPYIAGDSLTRPRLYAAYAQRTDALLSGTTGYGRYQSVAELRRQMSSSPGSGGDEPKPNKYLEKEVMIREAQQTVRKMYKDGAYQDALHVTQRLVEMVDDLFGREHAVYASALNDQALMLKSVGRLAEATDTYLKSLEVYRKVYNGEENASFAAALHNLGMTFRIMAEQGNKLEKIPLLERTQESFQRCFDIREKILPNNHPDLQLVRSRLAMVTGMLGGEKERTEARLRAALDGLIMAVGKEDAGTATAMTNLALFLKGEKKFDEAQELYTTVVYARQKVLGPKHMETVVAMFNLAELHQAAGREDEAGKIQNEIVAIGETMQKERDEAKAKEEAAMKAMTEQQDGGSDRGQEQQSEEDSKDTEIKEHESVATTWTPGNVEQNKK